MTRRIRPRRAEPSLLAELGGSVLRPFIAIAFAVAAGSLLFVWKPAPGPEGALLELVIRTYRPALWIVLGVAVVIALISVLGLARRTERW